MSEGLFSKHIVLNTEAEKPIPHSESKKIIKLIKHIYKYYKSNYRINRIPDFPFPPLELDPLNKIKFDIQSFFFKIINELCIEYIGEYDKSYHGFIDLKTPKKTSDSYFNYINNIKIIKEQDTNSQMFENFVKKKFKKLKILENKDDKQGNGLNIKTPPKGKNLYLIKIDYLKNKYIKIFIANYNENGDKGTVSPGKQEITPRPPPSYGYEDRKHPRTNYEKKQNADLNAGLIQRLTDAADKGHPEAIKRLEKMGEIVKDMGERAKIRHYKKEINKEQQFTENEKKQILIGLNDMILEKHNVFKSDVEQDIKDFAIFI